MAANLTNEIADTDKLTEYIGEAREMGIAILPPDVNLSEGEFTARTARSSTASWASRTWARRRSTPS